MPPPPRVGEMLFELRERATLPDAARTRRWRIPSRNPVSSSRSDADDPARGVGVTRSHRRRSAEGADRGAGRRRAGAREPLAGTASRPRRLDPERLAGAGRRRKRLAGRGGVARQVVGGDATLRGVGRGRLHEGELKLGGARGPSGGVLLRRIERRSPGPIAGASGPGSRPGGRGTGWASLAIGARRTGSRVGRAPSRLRMKFPAANAASARASGSMQLGRGRPLPHLEVQRDAARGEAAEYPPLGRDRDRRKRTSAIFGGLFGAPGIGTNRDLRGTTRTRGSRPGTCRGRPSGCCGPRASGA